jgi:hypothetical protein
MKGTQHIFFISCCLCTVFFAWLAFKSELKTEIIISQDHEKVLFTVDGKTVEWPCTANRLSSIEIKTSQSAFSVGYKQIIIEQGNNILWKSTQPATFSFKSRDYPPVGDWWVDYSGSEEQVFYKKLNFTGPFQLKATITGRSFHAIRFILNDDSGLQFEFKRGLLTNGFGISNERTMLAQGGFYPSSFSSIKNILHPYFLGASLACFLAAVFFLFLRSSPRINLAVSSSSMSNQKYCYMSALILFMASLGIFGWTAYSVLERLPHFQDDLCYLIRAKWLLAGHWFQPTPFYKEYLENFPFLYFDEQRQLILTRYPVNWSAMLAVGEFFKVPWIVAPVFGAAAVGLIFWIGKQMKDPVTAWTAALLATTSPLMIILSSSMLSHSATHFLCIAYVLTLIVGLEKKKPLFLILSGLAIGLAVGIRPLTAIGFLISGGLFFLVNMYKKRFCRSTWVQALLFITGLLVGIIPYLADNYLATGNALKPAFSLIGVGLDFNLKVLPERLLLADSTLALVPLHILGWGWRWCPPVLIAGLGCMFLIVPFLFQKWNRYDLLFVSIIIFVPITYLLHADNGIHGFGPRYYFEATFAFLLLTARGISVFTAWVRDNGIKSARVFAWIFILFLWITSLWSLPTRINLYEGYNEINSKLEDSINAKGITKGIIFLENDDHYNWIKAANLLSGDWESPSLVFASNKKQKELMDRLKDRPAYLWTSDHRLVLFELNNPAP